MIPAMLKTRNGRRAAASAALILLAVGTVRAFRGGYKPYSPEAPAYRRHGPADAPAVVSVFSDFQCPSCAFAVEPVKKLESLYEGQVRVVFKHHPWYFHRNARKAAFLAECAGKQGAFWPVHDKLFESQAEWAEAPDTKALFNGYLKGLKLDSAALEACVQDPATAVLIDADLEEAEEHWINGTPTFFVNGKRCAGLKQLRSTGVEEIERAIKARKAS